MGAAAGAIIIRKEKQLVAHFRVAHAIDATSALTPAALGVEQRFAWERLVDRAVIREAAPGTYYLDELTWGALRRARRRMAVMLLVLLFAILFPMLFLVK
jgi:hypothetical protein